MEKADNTQRAHLMLLMLALVMGSIVVWALGPVKGMPLLTAIAAVGALHLAVAIGAGAQKEWARVASLAMGCVMLIGFPIGTMVRHLPDRQREDRLAPGERPRYSGSLTVRMAGACGDGSRVRTAIRKGSKRRRPPRGGLRFLRCLYRLARRSLDAA
jgi:hypothetical protein